MVKTKLNLQSLNNIKKIILNKNELQLINKKLAKNISKNIQDDELNNRLVNIKTGNLRANIKTKSYSNDKDFFIDFFYNDKQVPYWKKLEFGYHGTQKISEHMRRITMAWGRPITPRIIKIRQHDRRVDFKERRFIRSNLEQKRNLYEQYLINEYKISYQNKLNSLK